MMTEERETERRERKRGISEASLRSHKQSFSNFDTFMA